MKRHDPAFQASGNKVTPDELGYDLQYVVINPATTETYFGTTAIGGTAAQKALVVINPKADYPRNLMFGVQGTNLTSGTWVVNGKDQFGNIITEAGTVAAATAGGTTLGTKIFSEVTSGTFSFSSGSVGNGTPKLGVATAGTTALFGLPAKLAATTDIKNIAMGYTGVGTNAAGTFVFGGTPSSATDIDNHAFKAPQTLVAGSTWFVVTYRPSYPDFDYSNSIT